MAKTNTVNLSIDLQELNTKLAQLQSKTGHSTAGARKQAKNSYKSYQEQKKLLSMKQERVSSSLVEGLRGKGLSKNLSESLTGLSTEGRYQRQHNFIASKGRQNFNRIYSQTVNEYKEVNRQREQSNASKPAGRSFEEMQLLPAQATVNDFSSSSASSKRVAKKGKKKPKPTRQATFSGTVGGVSLKRLAVYATIGSALRTGVQAALQSSVAAVSSGWKNASQASAVAASERFGASASFQNSQEKFGIINQQLSSHWTSFVPILGASMNARIKHKLMYNETIQSGMQQMSVASRLQQSGTGAAQQVAGLAFDMGLDRDVEAENSSADIAMERQAVMVQASRDQNKRGGGKNIGFKSGLLGADFASTAAVLDRLNAIVNSSKMNAQKNEIIEKLLENIETNTRNKN